MYYAPNVKNTVESPRKDIGKIVGAVAGVYLFSQFALFAGKTIDLQYSTSQEQHEFCSTFQDRSYFEKVGGIGYYLAPCLALDVKTDPKPL